jgi:3-phenylpropionate/cinnamic acid dioxygenase small subunit
VRSRAGPRWTAPVHEGPVADAVTHAEVAALLALEAEALDSRRFQQWEQLIDDDFVYQVPVPVLHDNAFEPPHDTGSLLIDETKASIVELWFARFGEEVYDVAWGDHPPVRLRHYVTNVRVRHADVADEYDVRSNSLVRMIRQTQHSGTLGAERFDRVRRAGDDLRIMSRFAVLDDLVLDAPLLRVIL